MDNLIRLVLPALWETLYMVVFSSVLALAIGAPLGIALVITEEGNIMELRGFNRMLSLVINAARSFPFIILMILISPLSKLIVGTTIGTSASIIPLSICAAPFVARVFETALKEVDKGIIEASISMGCSSKDIVIKVLIPEALPSIILGITLTVINILGYSAMAGAIGGGGLGDLALRYGYQRFETDIMIESVLLIIILVQIIQVTGNKVEKVISNKR